MNFFFFAIYCRPMDGHSGSVMGSNSASSTHSLSSALPLKPKKSEQTSMTSEHFTKVNGSDPKDPKSQYKYYNKLFSCHTKKQGTSVMLVHLSNIYKNIPVGLIKMISNNQS